VTPKQQRTVVGLATAGVLSLLLVSALASNQPVQVTQEPASPEAVQDAFLTIQQHVEPVPVPPGSPTAPVAVVPAVKTTSYRPVCPAPRCGYGPLRGGGWWHGGPVRRLFAGLFGRRWR
jgi:hypothetical protein